MRSLFLNGFNHIRNSETNETLKNHSRTIVLEHFQSLGLETFTHEFTIKHRTQSGGLIGSVLASDDQSIKEEQSSETGINLIGILPSKTRSSGSNASENLMLIGAHYDTVSKCPGVDDNGSGSVTTMIASTILTEFVRARGYSYENTSILFVLFDLEEKVGLF